MPTIDREVLERRRRLLEADEPSNLTDKWKRLLLDEVNGKRLSLVGRNTGRDWEYEIAVISPDNTYVVFDTVESLTPFSAVIECFDVACDCLTNNLSPHEIRRCLGLQVLRSDT